MHIPVIPAFCAHIIQVIRCLQVSPDLYKLFITGFLDNFPKLYKILCKAEVAELVDAADLKFAEHFARAGSSPALGIMKL